MKEIALTPSQVKKMRHALGMDKGKKLAPKYEAYRNYYTTGADPEWETLVDNGFALKRPDPFCSKDVVYHVTEEGLNILSEYLGIKINLQK